MEMQNIIPAIVRVPKGNYCYCCAFYNNSVGFHCILFDEELCVAHHFVHKNFKCIEAGKAFDSQHRRVIQV